MNNTEPNPVFDEPGESEVEESPAIEVSPEPTPVEAEAPPPEKSYEEKYSELQIALKQERAQMRAMREEAESLRQKFSEFGSLKEELENKRREQAEAKEREAFENNPAEYLKQRQEQLAQKFEQLTQAEQDQLQRYEMQQRMDGAIRTQAQQFMAKQPDYHQALEFVRDRKMQEYELYGIPAEQREQMFNQESIQFAQMALQNQRNAAEMVYQLAKTWGYSAQLAPPTSAEQRVVQLQNGQKAAGTLSTGTAPPRESMLARVEEMSDEEFDKFWDQEVKPSRRR